MDILPFFCAKNVDIFEKEFPCDLKFYGYLPIFVCKNVGILKMSVRVLSSFVDIFIENMDIPLFSEK